MAQKNLADLIGDVNTKQTAKTTTTSALDKINLERADAVTADNVAGADLDNATGILTNVIPAGRVFGSNGLAVEKLDGKLSVRPLEDPTTVTVEVPDPAPVDPTSDPNAPPAV